MWKSGGTKKSEPALPAGLPAPEPLPARRGPLRLLLVMVVLALTVVVIFPAVFTPKVEPPTEVMVGGPFATKVQVSNQNVTPLKDVEYSCEGTKLTMSNGIELADAKMLVRGMIRKIPGRTAVMANCESSYVVNAPLRAVEYKLTLMYKAFPWPQLRTAVFRIAAQVDGKGQVTKWNVTNLR